MAAVRERAMVALKVEDVRSFTSKLFVKEDFDRFLVKEINIIICSIAAGRRQFQSILGEKAIKLKKYSSRLNGVGISSPC